MSSGTNKRARLSPDPYSNSTSTSTSNSNSNLLHNHHHQQHQPPPLYPAPSSRAPTSAPSSNPNASSSFRNVSACNRCRIRKNRCDQNLPACTSCEKANVKCVGFDPITKREIPRTYVYFLESRVNHLEELLTSNGIPFTPPSTDFDLGSKPIIDQTASLSPQSENPTNSVNRHARTRSYTRTDTASDAGSDWEQKEESDKLSKLVSNIGMVSVHGASDPRYLGSTSGISFARVVFAAIKSSVSEKNGRGSRTASIGSAAAISSTSMRDSFFGLGQKPNIRPAPFPDRHLALRLVNLYFEHANPQIPILHRGEFMTMFGRAYAAKDRQRSPRELYLLNIVFAIGAAIILPDSSAKTSPNLTTPNSPPLKQEPGSPDSKKAKSSGEQRQPEEYHASAMMQLEAFLGSFPTADRPEGFGGGLEQLQAVLLLAGFALLRPVAPGLWYIIGVAVRLGVDLGLHFEDKAIEEDSIVGAVEYLRPGVAKNAASAQNSLDPKEAGRREWVRDLRRRLWWCVYSFDRLVSTCVGRPFGVTDQVITTQWYTVLDDKDITPEGFLLDPNTYNGPSYKRVAHHYLRLRLLQSEILQVLQHRQAKKAHAKNQPINNQYMHTTMTCPFLQPFDHSFYAWRVDIDRRLWEWKESTPLREDTTVEFNIKFLELNYWQAVIMLYRQSLGVPATLAGEKGPHHDVESPLSPHLDDHEDEEEIFLKVAEAGQRVLKLYRQLHRVHLVNYTYLATVHLFMAGIAFLYSIWHSPVVRARLTLEDVDFTVLAGTSVLNDLIEKCPPAEACRDAFDRMSKATIRMCQNTTGFGSQVRFTKEHHDDTSLVSPTYENTVAQPSFNAMHFGSARPPPQFDYNLKDLFSETSLEHAPSSINSDNSSATSSNFASWQQQQRMQQNQTGQFPYPSPTSTVTSLPAANPASATSRSQPPQFHEPTYQQSTSSSNPSASRQYDPRLLNSLPASSTAGDNYDLHSGANSSVPSISMAPDASNNLLSSGDNADFAFDFLLNHDPSPLPPTFTAGAAGLNVGFDGRHDWAEGNTSAGQGGQGLPDLFGDFFFGVGGSYGGGIWEGEGGMMEGLLGSGTGVGGGGGSGGAGTGRGDNGLMSGGDQGGENHGRAWGGGAGL